MAVRGAARLDKICRTIMLISFSAVLGYKFSMLQNGEDNVFTPSPEDAAKGLENNPQDYPGLKVSMAICIFSAYLYLYYFLMGFEFSGSFVLIMARIISRNIPFFMMFYAVVLVGFAATIALITNDGTPDYNYGMRHMIFVIWNLFKQTVNVQDFHEKDAYDYDSAPDSLKWILDITQTAFVFSVVILMLNLLIAMVNGN